MRSNKSEFMHFQDEPIHNSTKSRWKNEFSVQRDTQINTPSPNDNRLVILGQISSPQRVISPPQESESPSPKKQGKGHKHHKYNPLAIPPDWEIATNHALSRRGAQEDQETETKTVCPCCGYQVERIEIGICESVSKMNFLGAGFPLFYNFVNYSIFMLFQFLCVKGGYNLIMNINGNYCENSSTQLTALQCPDDWIHVLSIANNLNNQEVFHQSEFLGLLLVIMEMITLVFFRASQRQLDSDIDSSFNSPSDYTIMVTQIPVKLKIDYHNELEKVFSTFGEVRKIILVHDIQEIISLEQQLDGLVKKKKDLILQRRYSYFKITFDSFNYKHPDVLEYDKLIHAKHKEISQKEKHLDEENEKFEGLALVSFQTETEKDKVLDLYSQTFSQQVRDYFSFSSETHGGVSFMGKPIKAEQAPEPNDIDWMNIHSKPRDRLIGNVKSHVLTGMFMVGLFFMLWGITIWKGKILATLQGKTDTWASVRIGILTQLIPWTIVLFNKFFIGRVLHNISNKYKQQIIRLFVLMEKNQTKTKFNISMSQKVVIILFINTAMLTYIIDFLINNNIVGPSGFIENETNVFIVNSIVTVAVWAIDPWYLQKLWDRNTVLHSETTVITQQEANLLMEDCDYSQAKRYCDIMKTVWFTFFYGGIIPIGLVLSLATLILYYWVDKFNVLRRRTLKDSISRELSIAMIEYLEMILIFYALGSMKLAQDLFGEILWMHILILIIGVIYSILPMEIITEKLFKFSNEDEVITYDEAYKDFDTDYDRENPVTRAFALKKWQQLLEKEHIENHHQHAENLQGFAHQFG